MTGWRISTEVPGSRAGRVLLATAATLLVAALGTAAGSASEPVLDPSTLPPGPGEVDPASPASPAAGQDSAPADSSGEATTSGSGGTNTSPASSGIRLALADADPQRFFFYNGHPSRFRYRLKGTKQRNIRIVVSRRGSGKVIRAFVRDKVEPGVNHRITWNGVGRHGNVAPRGSYRYRVESQGGAPADAGGASGDDTFRSYTDKFPVRGSHTYGDGIGAGRGHQGQDVFASCGTRVVAARGGRVQYRAYHSAAGNYAVIDIRGSGRDYAYMHLLRPAVVAKGERVYTGQRIGNVGQTGNATGCHLHFEMWSAPGWYEGGNFMNPTPYLKEWDHYS